MKNQWYIACQSGQLKSKPLARTIMDQHIVLFRNHTGKPGALIDRCIHRNLALSRGRITEQGLQCHYHGWTYDLEGQCTHIPAACEACGAANQPKVRAYRVVEKQGFVWVYIAEGKGGHPDHAPMDFPQYAARGWHTWVMERTFAGHAFHCVENFLDVPHTAHVHKGLFRSKESKTIQIEITTGKDWVQAEFLNEERMESLVGKLLFPKNARLVHTDRFMLPYTTRVDYRINDKRHFIIMSQCTPIDEHSTRVFTYMAYRFSPLGRLVRCIFEPLSNCILNQDVDIIQEQTADIQKTGPKKFLFHPTDVIAKEMRDLIDGKSLENHAPRTIRLRI